MQDFTPLVVGIDVGGTKTHLRACAGPDVVADHIRASSGWRPHDPAAAADWLTALVHDALPARTRPSAVAVGGHACETPRQCAEIRAALEERLKVPALVVGDAELLVPAAGLDKGVGLVAGTGSVAVGLLADGGRLQVGGWGAVLGDEGGAAGLVREAARAAWAAHDRGEAPDELALGLVEAFGVAEVPALGAALESASDVSADWGRHARVVFTAADAGSLHAREVIAEAAVPSPHSSYGSPNAASPSTTWWSRAAPSSPSPACTTPSPPHSPSGCRGRGRGPSRCRPSRAPWHWPDRSCEPHGPRSPGGHAVDAGPPPTGHGPP